MQRSSAGSAASGCWSAPARRPSRGLAADLDCRLTHLGADVVARSRDQRAHLEGCRDRGDRSAHRRWRRAGYCAASLRGTPWRIASRSDPRASGRRPACATSSACWSRTRWMLAVEGARRLRCARQACWRSAAGSTCSQATACTGPRCGTRDDRPQNNLRHQTQRQRRTDPRLLSGAAPRGFTWPGHRGTLLLASLSAGCEARSAGKGAGSPIRLRGGLEASSRRRPGAARRACALIARRHRGGWPDLSDCHPERGGGPVARGRRRRPVGRAGNRVRAG